MEFQDGVASLSRQQKIKFELSSIDGGYPLQVRKPPTDDPTLTHYSGGHEVPPKKASGPPQLPKIRGPVGDLNVS